MILSALVCVALIALVGYQQHTHRQDRNELLAMRFEHPDLTPVLPLEADEDGPEGLAEHDEYLQVVRGEPVE